MIREDVRFTQNLILIGSGETTGEIIAGLGVDTIDAHIVAFRLEGDDRPNEIDARATSFRITVFEKQKGVSDGLSFQRCFVKFVILSRC